MGRKGAKAPKPPAAAVGPKVCGPTLVETLCGRLLGREVAIVCCGEAHEEAIDLTRARCVTEAAEGWAPLAATEEEGWFDPADKLASQESLSLEGAKAWAERILSSAGAADESDSSDDDEDEDEVGGYLVFEERPAGLFSKARGVATVFPADAALKPGKRRPPGASALEWGDLDLDARAFNRRRLGGERIPTEEHDAMIDRRKVARLDEGVEFLDDWVLRQAAFEDLHVAVLLESPVHPDEVELHVEPGAGPAPPAHECLRRVELDSDADSEDEDDPDDGSGYFADYFFRRAAAGLPPGRVRGFEPRDLGDAGDDSLREGFHALLAGCPEAPADAEEEELQRLGAELAIDDPEEGPSTDAWKEERSRRCPPVPSWEAFFGAAAELLYYSPQVKGDYAPFLARCVRTPAKMWAFFDALYFGTVPEAVAVADLSPDQRPLAQVRSLAFRPPGAGAPLLRRPPVQSKVPVRAAPLERYLKAKGSEPPRTWVSGLAARLRAAGCAKLVGATQAWFRERVAYLLDDPKEADTEGDYFAAWLRACHRDVWDDIDRSDPEELRRRQWVPSVAHPKSKKHRHALKDITIPGLDEAFRELAAFDPGARASTKRERVLAKIVVDGFQLRLVDVAAVLSVADAVLSAPEGARVAVVLYAGEDHTKSVAEFWRGQGFSSVGRVGKSDWEDDEPRALGFPGYLQDLRTLFPVPR